MLEGVQLVGGDGRLEGVELRDGAADVEGEGLDVGGRYRRDGRVAGEGLACRLPTV